MMAYAHAYEAEQFPEEGDYTYALSRRADGSSDVYLKGTLVGSWRNYVFYPEPNYVGVTAPLMKFLLGYA